MWIRFVNMIAILFDIILQVHVNWQDTVEKEGEVWEGYAHISVQ